MKNLILMMFLVFSATLGTTALAQTPDFEKADVETIEKFYQSLPASSSLKELDEAFLAKANLKVTASDSLMTLSEGNNILEKNRRVISLYQGSFDGEDILITIVQPGRGSVFMKINGSYREIIKEDLSELRGTRISGLKFLGQKQAILRLNFIATGGPMFVLIDLKKQAVISTNGY